MRIGRKRDKERVHIHGREPALPEGLGETEGRSGGDYIYEQGSLVAAAEDVDKVRSLLQEMEVKVAETERVAAGDTTRLQVSSDREVPALVDALRERQPDLRVGPNHVLAITSHMSAIPVTAPRTEAQRRPLYEEPGLPGEGVSIGVLDTGAWDHSFFAGRCEFRSPDDLDEADADGDGLLDYPAGHGTFIAGVILQHAPRAKVVARRLPPPPEPAPRQSYTTDTVLANTLAGLPELGRVDVLSLSVGGYTHDGMGLIATEGVLRDYLAANPDLVIVAGAGNDATDQPFFPAASKRVVAVGALDASGRGRACFSNYGWWVDACAPGVDVHSTFLEWDGELAPYPSGPPRGCDGVLAPPPTGPVTFKGWARWDGTSFAGPRVAAAIACRIAAGRAPHEAVFDVVHAPGTHRVPGLGTLVNPRTYP